MKLFLITGSLLLFLLLHIFATFSDVNLYPFVKYDMFAKANLTNGFTGLALATVDTKEDFLFFTQFSNAFFFPFNQRGFYNSFFTAFKAASPEGQRKLFASLFKDLKVKRPQMNGLKLYRIECSCEGFNPEQDKIITYLSHKNCKKILIYAFSN